jgi:hypothetical protein
MEDKMEISIFLAKSLGLYFIIVSVGMLLNGNKLKPILVDFLKDPGMVLMSGFLALIIGILIVVSHNIWVMGWPVIITVLGWFSLFKGIIRFMCPEMVINKTSIWIESRTTYNISLFIILLLGVVLLYFGYVHG